MTELPLSAGLTGPLAGPLAFLAGGALVSGVGLYVLARGSDATRRLAFFHLCTVLGIWSIVSGSALSAPAAETARFWATAACLLSLLVITTAYRVAVQALGVEREGRSALRILASVAGVAAIFAATGRLDLVEVLPAMSAGGAGAGAAGAGATGAAAAAGGAGAAEAASAASGAGHFLPHLRWPALLLVAAVVLAVLDALQLTLRQWRAENTELGGRRAAWIAFGLVATGGVLLQYLPMESVTSLPVGTISGAAGVLALARVAWEDAEPPRRRAAVVEAVLAATQSPLLVCSRDGSVRAVSEAVTRVFGHDDTLVGQTIFGLLDDPAQDAMTVRRILAHGSTSGANPGLVLRTTGGERVLAHMDAARLGHVHGETAGVLVILHHLQDREAADERLEGFHRRFRNERARSPVALGVITASDGRVLEANDELVDLTNDLRLEVMGSTVEELGLVPRGSAWRRLVGRVPEDGWSEELSAGYRPAGAGRSQKSRLFFRRLSFDGQDCLLLVAHDLGERQQPGGSPDEPVLYDPLTDLPNRILFRHRLKRALERAWRQGHRVGVLFVEVAGIEGARDRRDPDVIGDVGESAQEEIVGRAAERLAECFRTRDTLSRFGRQRLAAVLEELDDEKDARAVADRVLETLGRPFRAKGELAEIQVSVGVVLDGPTKAESARIKAPRTREDWIGLGGPSARRRPDREWSRHRARETSSPVEPRIDLDRLLERTDAALRRARSRGGGIEVEPA